jgi:hypothetical protein
MLCYDLVDVFLLSYWLTETVLLRAVSKIFYAALLLLPGSKCDFEVLRLASRDVTNCDGWRLLIG